MGLMKKLMSALVAASLVLSLVGTASAGILDNPEFGLERMHELDLVKGRTNEDGTVDLAPNDPITRAELVTIFVRAFGKEDLAALVQDANVFPDTVGHWANGYVAIAKQMMEQNGYPLGLPDGNFDPDGQVTAAQAVAFLMKFMGVAPDTTQSWPMDYVQGALNAGLITEQDYADIEPILNTPTPATRALVFYLADQAFYNFPHGDGTVYTTYVDVDPPALTVDELAATTTDAAVTVTGSTDGVSVLVNDTEVEIDADGNFAADVELALGENEIVIAAFDRVGNMTPAEMVITRTTGAAVAIEAEDIIVAAGEQVELEAAVVDANGNVIEDAEILVEGDAGSLEGAIYTAPETAGEYTLNLSYEDLTATIDVTVVPAELAEVVADTESASPNSKVQLIATDAYGNEIEGAEFAVESGDAVVDAATGIFVAFEAGNYTVTATKDGMTATGTVAVYGDVDSLVVEVPESIVANGATEYTVTVKAVDAEGNVVASYDEPVDIDADTLTYDNSESEWADGIYTFTLTAPVGTAGAEYDITVTQSDDTAITGSATVNVIAQVAEALEVSFSEDYLTIDNGNGFVNGEVTVLDQEGKPMASGFGWEVALTVTGPATFADGETEETLVATGDGTPFTLYAIDVTQVGTATVSASYTGWETASDSVTVVNAFAASKLSLTQESTEAAKAGDVDGEVYFLKLQQTDKNGVPVKAGALGQSVTLTFAADSGENLYVAADADMAAIDTPTEVIAAGEMVGADDEAVVQIPADSSFTYVAVVSTATGTFSVTAEATDDSGNDYTSASSSVSFTAGDVAGAEFTRDTAIDVLANTATELTIQLVDEEGNEVAKEGVTVKFAAASGDESYLKLNGKNEAYTTTTDANGQASVEASALPYDDYTFDVQVVVDIDGDDDLDEEAVSDSLTLYVQDSIATSMSIVTYGVDEGTGEDAGRKTAFEAGAYLRIKVLLKDNNGLAIADPNYYAGLEWDGIEFGTDVFEIEGDVQNPANWIDDPESDYFYIDLTPVKAGSYTITLSDPNVAAEVKASRAVSVYAAAADHLEVAEAELNDAGDAFDLDAVEGKVKAFTVQVVDEYGNKVSPSAVTTAVPFEITLGTVAGYADVRSAENGGFDNTFSISATRTSTTFYVVADADFDFTITLTDADGDDTNGVQPALTPVSPRASYTYYVTVEAE